MQGNIPKSISDFLSVQHCARSWLGDQGKPKHLLLTSKCQSTANWQQATTLAIIPSNC